MATCWGQEASSEDTGTVVEEVEEGSVEKVENKTYDNPNITATTRELQEAHWNKTKRYFRRMIWVKKVDE